MLTQSNAIMLYAAEKSRTLLPASGVERARALKWLFFFVTDVIAPSARLSSWAANSTATHTDAIKQIKERAFALYEHADRRLADRPFLAGSIFTLADIAGHTITTAFEGELKWHALPHVRRWLEHVGARPAVQRGRRCSLETTSRASATICLTRQLGAEFHLWLDCLRATADILQPKETQ